MTHLITESVVILAEINITPVQPPGADGLTRVVSWLAWLVTLAGVAALIYAGGKFGWERWHGGAVESPKIVLGALAGGIVATSAGQIMDQIVSS
ncbi:hypothetical protein [Nocardia transvalensis]|uniref:hypothetical protein n=1 Tax=Nocardia transvalensis TaxID=37333 RepID=UPI00189377C9|nr:hypothetical protein [Nocardia transvalensis]MBF6331806.1 hypothetical protein [Nocardia transvalensis]